MKKLMWVLFVTLSIALVPLVSLAEGGNKMPSKFTYVIRPKDMGGDMFFLDLVELKFNWGKHAQEADDKGKEFVYVQGHFDELLTAAIGQWRSYLRLQFVEIVSITPVSSVRGTEECVTTGLIILCARGASQTTQR